MESHGGGITLSELEDLARSILKENIDSVTDSVGVHQRHLHDQLQSWKRGWERKKEVPSEGRIYGLAVRGVISFAHQGDPHAKKACLEAAADFLRNGVPFPKSLAEYISEFCLKATKDQSSLANNFDNFQRDITIGAAILGLTDESNVRATRGAEHKFPGSKRLSACFIVSKVLEAFGCHLSENGVEAAWKGVKDAYLPPWDPDSYRDGKRKVPKLKKIWPDHDHRPVRKIRLKSKGLKAK